MKHIFLSLFIAILAISCGPGERPTETEEATEEVVAEDTLVQETEEPVEEVLEADTMEAEPVVGGTEGPDVELPVKEEPVVKKGRTRVKISTDFGDMIIELYDETPGHRDNFVKLAKQGFYDGTLFHRVIGGFMIQGGDPSSKGATANAQLGSGGPGYTIPAEFNPKFYHKKGALAAARTSNPQKRSSGSQFYIVQGMKLGAGQLPPKNYTPEMIKTYAEQGGTPHLDGEYTVYGEVVKGLDVIDKIAVAPTGYANRPVQDIKMTVTVL